MQIGETGFQDHQILERECKIRNAFAEGIRNGKERRGSERLIGTEVTHQCGNLRADMRTVDESDIIREWEFKIVADYSAIGQILTYVAQLKKNTDSKGLLKG